MKVKCFICDWEGELKDILNHAKHSWNDYKKSMMNKEDLI